MVYVIDVSDPAKPVEVRSVPVQMGFGDHARGRHRRAGGAGLGQLCLRHQGLLESGADGRDQMAAATRGRRPARRWRGGGGLLPHDLRVNHAGTKVYASFGLWEADITNLDDPSTWKITDHRCELAAQQPGPWKEVHRQTIKAGVNLCVDATRPTPQVPTTHSRASRLQTCC